MAIRIINLRHYVPIANEILIKVDRSSPLGNPFILHSENGRDRVCDLYEEWFANQLRCAVTRNDEFLEYYFNICETMKTHNVALGCWCAPKRCHARTILAYMEKYNSQYLHTL